MILIKKMQTSECKKVLSHAKSSGESYEDLTSEEKDAIRESLLKEQKYLCAYCMRRLDGTGSVKIEHFKPRSSYPGLSLNYSNMFAVCNGNEGHPYSDQTCDTHKRDMEIEADPTKSYVVETIRYKKKSGTIYSTDERINKDLNEVLNLNKVGGALISSRKNAVLSLKTKLHQKSRRSGNISVLLHSLDKVYNNEDTTKLKPYVGILRWYVKEELKKYD